MAAMALLAHGALAHADLGIDARLSHPSPWLREEVVLTVEVIDDRSLIEQTLPPWTPAGVMLRPLAGQQERIRTEQGVRILHRHRWALMPLYPGPIELQPPAVEARVAGGGRVTLTPPALHLDARPLDPLIPAELPVSALRLSADPLPEAIPRGRPLTWTIHVEGQGLSARGLRPWLDEALRDAPGLRAYPPDIRLEDNIAPESPMLQRLTARVVLEPRASGLVRLPGLKLPYVDPTDGQPRLARLTGSEVRVMHPLWLAVRPWLPWAASGLLLAAALWLTRPRWRAWRCRQAWLRVLREARTPAALRKAWRQGASAPADDSTRTLLDRLDVACYGRFPLNETTFTELKTRLIERGLRPHPREV